MLVWYFFFFFLLYVFITNFFEMIAIYLCSAQQKQCEHSPKYFCNFFQLIAIHMFLNI